MVEDFRFLRPWTQMLPQDFPCVLAVVGSGAKTTLIARLHREYRREGRRVLVTRSAPGPAPAGDFGELVETDVDVRQILEREGSAILERAGVEVDLREWAECVGAEVVLVEAQASTGSLVWPEAPPPALPRGCTFACAVANLQALGRLWSPEVVHADPGQTDPTRRVEVGDLLASMPRSTTGDGRLEGGVPWIPFLTGFGALRDIDAMFSIGRELWEEHGARWLGFGELLGDERRDLADRAGVEDTPAAQQFLQEDRIYVIYPASVDSA